MSAAISVIVTELELVPPAKPRVGMPSGHTLGLLRVPKPSLHFYRYLQFRVGKKWHWVTRLKMSDDDLATIIHAPHIDISVLMLDGAPSGFFEINRADAANVEIAYFGMMQHATGRGLGRWFLSEAIYAAFSQGAEKLQVSTCTLDHPAALSLYQKSGFQAVGRHEALITPLTEAELLQVMASDR